MNLKAQVIAINRLLSDIYEQEMRLSYLLSKLDFNNENVNLIGSELLLDAVAIFSETLEKTIITFQDGARQFKIVRDSYGLMGNSQTLRQLAAEFDISHERVRQLKQKTLRKLKSTNQQSNFESLFKSKIQQTLEVYKNQLPTTFDNILDSKYNFTLSSRSNGERYLTIAEGNNRITIAESDFLKFCNNIEAVSSKWGIKTYSVEEVREKHKKAYAKWTQEEEELLINSFAEGLNVKEIAAILERQPGAIASRINKLGLNN